MKNSIITFYYRNNYVAILDFYNPGYKMNIFTSSKLELDKYIQESIQDVTSKSPSDSLFVFSRKHFYGFDIISGILEYILPKTFFFIRRKMELDQILIDRG